MFGAREAVLEDILCSLSSRRRLLRGDKVVVLSVQTGGRVRQNPRHVGGDDLLQKIRNDSNLARGAQLVKRGRRMEGGSASIPVLREATELGQVVALSLLVQCIVKGLRRSLHPATPLLTRGSHQSQTAARPTQPTRPTLSALVVGSPNPSSGCWRGRHATLHNAGIAKQEIASPQLGWYPRIEDH